MPNSSSEIEVGELASAAAHQLPELRAFLDAALVDPPSLEAGAQRFSEQLRSELGQAVALARVYATISAAQLPAPERAFATRLARTAQVTLRRDTPVLTLLGTSGDEAEWNHRRNSKSHLAIPLLGRDFVSDIPMIAQLLLELGVDIALLDHDPIVMARKLVGGLNGVFFVPRADEARDAHGRLVIPDRGFVRAHDIHSVFGMGGSYLDGSLVTAIVFSRECISRRTAERLATLIARLKIATEACVSAGRLFEASSLP